MCELIRRVEPSRDMNDMYSFVAMNAQKVHRDHRVLTVAVWT